MAVLSVTQVSGQTASDALAKDATDPVGGDSFPYSENAIAIFDNTAVGAESVTVTGGNEPEYGCALSETINLGIGECKVFGRLKAAWSVAGSVTFLSSDAGVLASVIDVRP